MKYEISQSRLNSVIQNYITNMLSNLTKNSAPSEEMGFMEDFNYMWWEDPTGRKLFEGIDKEDGFLLGIHKTLSSSVQDFFQLNEEDTKDSFTLWMIKNYGIPEPHDVYEFEYDD